MPSAVIRKEATVANVDQGTRRQPMGFARTWMSVASTLTTAELIPYALTEMEDSYATVYSVTNRNLTAKIA